MEFNWNDEFDVENSIRWTLLIEITQYCARLCVWLVFDVTTISILSSNSCCLFNNASAHQIRFMLSNIEYD